MSYRFQQMQPLIRPYETWVEDEQHPFTITFSGIAKAALINMAVVNVTKGTRFEWSRETGSFDPPIQAGTNDQLRFEFTIENQGEPGTVYLVLWNVILDRALSSGVSPRITTGEHWSFIADTDIDTGDPILMPMDDMSLVVSVGHKIS